MTTTARRVPIPRNGVDYRRKVVLAPMVRSGELPSRLLALKYGADLVWGPETIDRALIGTTRRYNSDTQTVDFTRLPSNGGRVPTEVQKESLIYRLHPTREHGRLIYQIGTSSPTLAVEAAKIVAADVAGIDVNAGCPKPFSTSGGMGAALLRTPDLLASILEALVKEVGEIWEIGISVKIRLLETPEQTEALVRKLCGTGITGLTIHCRTTPMRPRERAIREQLKMIASVCREYGVACLMNGDVDDRDQALQLAQEFGVDGGMIATKAESNPSCFRTKEQGGLLFWPEVTREYIKTAIEVENRWGNTKYLLGQLIPGKAPDYKKVAGSKGYQEVCEMLMLEDLLDQARDVDRKLGLGAYYTDTSRKAVAKAKTNQSARAAGQKSGRIRLPSSETRNPLAERGVGVSPALAMGL
ncbi:hypothetical protein MMC16_000394 [Acarospora aff. strigata]|nr:hypothetical protein [Acarospora aff. strigata]